VLVEGDSNTFGNLATAVNTAANLPGVIAVSACAHTVFIPSHSIIATAIIDLIIVVVFISI
jgi:hypothetical protein